MGAEEDAAAPVPAGQEVGTAFGHRLEVAGEPALTQPRREELLGRRLLIVGRDRDELGQDGDDAVLHSCTVYLRSK
jgi:hypothetical protein